MPRLDEEQAWLTIDRAVTASGLETPLSGSVIDGQLHHAWIDMRAMLGMCCEYVRLRGEALEICADVPRN